MRRLYLIRNTTRERSSRTLDFSQGRHLAEHVALNYYVFWNWTKSASITVHFTSQEE